MKKSVSSFLIYLLLLASVSAQVSLDSLREVAGDERQADSNRIQAIYHLSNHYESVSMDSFAHFTQQLHQLSATYGSARWLAIAQQQMGFLFDYQGISDSAKQWYFRSMTLARTLGDAQLEADNLNNLGLVYERQEQLEKALSYLYQSLAIREKTGRRKGGIPTRNNIAKIHLKQRELDRAMFHVKQSLEMAEVERDTMQVFNAVNLMGTVYRMQGNLEAAIACHRRGLALTRKLNYMRGEASSLSNIASIFQRRGDEQDKKDAVAKAELARRNLQRNASLGGLSLVALLAVLLFVNGRRRRKTNELLNLQKAEIEAKSTQNELLLKEIHHRVKNNLQTISSLLYLQSAHIKDAEVKEAVAAGQHRVESMALIHQKLYQRDNVAAIEMRDYLQNLVQSLIDTFDADPERIRFELDMPELELDVDTAVPLGLIVNELITNSLKYAFPDGRSGKIRVSLARQPEGKLELYVADDGVGANNTQTGTAFGSQLVKLLTTQLGGKLEQGSDLGYWTRVVV